MNLEEYSTKELVDELSKREGVETYFVPVEGKYSMMVIDKYYEYITNDYDEKGPAIILKVID